MTDLAALRALAEQATPGPWEWYGDTHNRNVYLSSVGRGREFVMRFVRWGMRGAQPIFGGPHAMVAASEAPIYEVAPDATDPADPRLYRHDFIGIRNANAAYIAALDPTTVLALIDQAEQAGRLATALEEMAGRWEEDADFIEETKVGTKTRRAIAAETMRQAAGEVRAALRDGAGG